LAGNEPDELKKRLDDFNQEIRRVNDQIHERRLKGKPVDELEQKLEELEQSKHEIVERIQDIWNS